MNEKIDKLTYLKAFNFFTQQNYSDYLLGMRKIRDLKRTLDIVRGNTSWA
jgi:hypothetical protein